MKTFLVIAVGGVLVYLATWTLAYIWFMGWDFRYYLQYLKLSWTRPGEIPAFIQWVAIAITVVAIGSLLWWKKSH
jgi:hypothetical protein